MYSTRHSLVRLNSETERKFQEGRPNFSIDVSVNLSTALPASKVTVVNVSTSTDLVCTALRRLGLLISISIHAVSFVAMTSILSPVARHILETVAMTYLTSTIRAYSQKTTLPYQYCYVPTQAVSPSSVQTEHVSALLFSPDH